jgi:hypothetical protein
LKEVFSTSSSVSEEDALMDVVGFREEIGFAMDATDAVTHILSAVQQKRASALTSRSLKFES